MSTAVGGLLLLAACASAGRDSVVKIPGVCKDIQIPIYFEPREAEVTPDGRKLIAMEAERARHCKVDSVRVVGLADSVGEPAANMELSKARASSVADAIVKAGLPPAEFDLQAAGQAGSVTAGGQLQPVRRRADVTLKLSKP
jgi:outer membrane protein OmpA-like peptidoglycan-associated protein